MATGTSAEAARSATDTQAGEGPTANDSSDPSGSDPTDRDRWARWCVIGATLAAVLPIMVAGVRGALRGWLPTGDDAYSAVRAWDLFTSNPPLLGTWSSASDYTGHEINHPGPLQFDLLAVPVRLLGPGPGTAIGLALVNALAVLAIAWLVQRSLGPAAATLAMAASALLSWSMGSEMLYDPWSQHAPLIPFSLFLVAVWCLVAGDLAAAPVMVVAGSYAFQTHLSYTLLVPGLVVFALVVVAVRLWTIRRRRPDQWAEGRGSTGRWLLLTLAVTLVCWTQPLIQQAVGEGEGNILGLLRSAGADAPTPGWGRTIRAFGGTVAVPPMWLAPSFGSPSFHLSGSGRATWLAAAALVALAAALAGLGWRAWRRGSTAVAAGCATALATLGVGFLTTYQMPIRLGMVPTYARFMWPLGMLVWLVLGVAVLDEVRVRARWAGRVQPATGPSEPALVQARTRAGTADGWRPSAPRWLALPGLVLAVVAGAATLPTVDNGTGSPPWSVDAVDGFEDDLLAAVEDEGPVLVELENHLSVNAVGPAVFWLLQDAGIPFVVDEVHLVSQLGTARRAEPGEAEVRLIVRGGPAARAGEGEELIASWRPLSDAEEVELTRLTDELREVVAEHGVPLTEAGHRILTELGSTQLLDDIAAAQDDPEPLVDTGALRELWAGVPVEYEGRPVIDAEALRTKFRSFLDRWSDLFDRHDSRPISLYLAPA